MATTNGPGLKEFAPDIVLVDGPMVRDFGFPFTTRMTIVRLSDGALWIDSPVPVAPDTLAQIQAWGPVRYLVAGTPRHVWRLRTWHRQFPDAELWVCRKQPARFRHLPWTGVLGPKAANPWASDLDYHVFQGSALLEEVCFFHAKSRTLIMNDLIQHHQKQAGKPLRNALLTWAGSSGARGDVPLDIRWSFRDRARARQSLAQLMSWDFERLVIAHGPCVEQGAKDVVMQAFRWLR